MRSSPSAIAVALLAIFSSFGAAQERADDPFSPPSKTGFKTAERKITLVYDPHFPISSHAINEIIQSKDLASAAIGELTGARVNLKSMNDGGALQRVEGSAGWGPEKSDKWYLSFVQQRQHLVGGETRGTFPLRLVVAGTEAVGESELEKYSDLVIKHLNNVLADLSRRAFESKRKELNLVAEQAQETAELARQKLNETRDRIRRASGEFSESTIQELVTSLKKQEQALQVDLAGMNGRAAAIQQEVAKTADRAKKDSADDDIVKKLMRVVELRKRQLSLVRELAEQGVPGGEPQKVAGAEEQVALAEVSLAESKRANSRPAGDQLDKLNTELAQIAVSMAESKAKLEYVAERLQIYEHWLKDAADAKPLREQLDKQTGALVSLQAQADKATAEVRQLEASFRPARVEAFELRTGDDKAVDTEKRERK